MAKSASSEAYSLFNRRKHVQASQRVRNHSYFSKPGRNRRNRLGGCLDGDFGMNAATHLSYQREGDNSPRLTLSSDEIHLALRSMNDGNVCSCSRCQMVLILMDCEYRDHRDMLQTRSAGLTPDSFPQFHRSPEMRLSRLSCFSSASLLRLLPPEGQRPSRLVLLSPKSAL